MVRGLSASSISLDGLATVELIGDPYSSCFDLLVQQLLGTWSWSGRNDDLADSWTFLICTSSADLQQLILLESSTTSFDSGFIISWISSAAWSFEHAGCSCCCNVDGAVAAVLSSTRVTLRTSSPAAPSAAAVSHPSDSSWSPGLPFPADSPCTCSSSQEQQVQIQSYNQSSCWIQPTS